MGARAKISITLERETVDALDRAVADRRFPSRSEAVERALSDWVRRERRRLRDAQIDAYYDALGPDEAAEDRGWAELGGASMVREAALGRMAAERAATRRPDRRRRRARERGA